MTEKRNRSKTPVSSFGPELLAALVKGGASPLELVCIDSKVATKLVQRLYTLRKRMREENHPQADLAQRAKVSNQKGGKRLNVITISPHDWEFKDILAKAGIQTAELPPTLLTDLAVETGEPSTILEALDKETKQ
jgi:hypothetical protein